MLLVCLCVSVACGAANKIKEFVTFDPEPLDANGMTILKHAAGKDKTILQLVLSDFSPATTYDLALVKNGHTAEYVDGVWRVADDSYYTVKMFGDPATDFLTTDKHGHLTYHTSIDDAFVGDQGNRDVLIFKDVVDVQRECDEYGNQIGWTFQGDLRAIGLNPAQ